MATVALPLPHEVYETEDWRFVAQPKVEGQWFERKAHAVSHPPKELKTFVYEKVARTVVGFANSNPDKGGLLVIGVGDHGEVVGIDRLGVDYPNVILAAHESLDGPIPLNKLVAVTREDGADDHVIFIYTPFLQGRLASTTRGEVTVRRGDDTTTLRPEGVQALTYEKGHLHFEDEPAIPFDLAQLDLVIVREFVDQLTRSRGAPDMDAERALRVARLLVSRDGALWLTKGGILVFHKDPRQVIPGAYVRYLRYEGRDVESTLQRDASFEGPVPTLIQKLREFMPTQISRFSFRRDGQLTSEDEYPPAAWDEAIVNALVHRSYSQQTRPVRINQFPDRLEVISPGGYPLGVTPEAFVHTPRNTNLMDALRHLNFVRMAEEGTRTMRRVMKEAGLPPPRFSSPELTERVECTLHNDIDERTRARSDGQAAAPDRRPTSLATNMFPLKIQSPPSDPDEPFGSEEALRPTFGDVRAALLRRLREVGFNIDSFASTTAVDFSQEHIVPSLRGKGLLSIYPGLEFRLTEFGGTYLLVVDHTVEVRNRAHAARVRRAVPWISLGARRHCFVRQEGKWAAGYIVGEQGAELLVELRTDQQGAEAAPPTVGLAFDDVIPSLTTSELSAMLQAERIPLNLPQEIRRASLVGGKDASRRRWGRIQELVQQLATRVFPLVVGPHEILLSNTPADVRERPLRLGRRLRDPKAQFDAQGRLQEEDVVRGLTTFGSLEKPREKLPLVLLGPTRWIGELQEFVERLRLGRRPFRGMEATFGLQIGAITTVIAEPDDYERKAQEAIAHLADEQRPVFIVLSPQSRASQVTYDSPYYRIKRLLLQEGFPSQMVNEDTLEDPEWKDLNFALDIFAKAGHVPWVLGEGMPQADLFVGLSSSWIRHGANSSRVVGYANVFDEYGRWLFYQGASTAVPYDQRNRMYAGLLADITREYQAKRRKLQWVHVHHGAKLNRDDRNEIVRGILSEAPEAEVTFAHINEHSAYRLFDESPQGDGAAARGTWVSLASNRFLLATTGPNPMGQKYLGTPRPLEVSVYRVGGDTRVDLPTYAQHMMSLTRLNWASTRSFCHTPITIKFANDIAHLMNVVHSAGEDFRLHPALRSTPWFL